MTASGGGNANWGMQARQAGEQGGGDPSLRPRGSDKRAVIVMFVGVTALIAGLLLLG